MMKIRCLLLVSISYIGLCSLAQADISEGGKEFIFTHTSKGVEQTSAASFGVMKNRGLNTAAVLEHTHLLHLDSHSQLLSFQQNYPHKGQEASRLEIREQDTGNRALTAAVCFVTDTGNCSGNKYGGANTSDNSSSDTDNTVSDSSSQGSNSGSKISGTSSKDKTSSGSDMKRFAGTTLTYATWIDPAKDEGGAVLKKFEQATGMKVKIRLTSQDSYVQDVAALIVAGNAPDMLFCNGTFPSILSVLQPLDNTKLNLKDPIWDQSVLEGSKLNGKYYLVDTVGSIWGGANCVFYNKKLLRDKNITTPEEYYKQGKWTFAAMKKDQGPMLHSWVAIM